MSGVVVLGPVEVAGVVAWASAVDLWEWPQQSFSELKPAMVTDLGWHGFGAETDQVVEDVMERFYPGRQHRQRMLSVVMPGHSIHRHVDQQPPNWVTRVHVPLTSNDRSYFNSGGISYSMTPGTAYAVDTRVAHGVSNDGEMPRLHMMFDVFS